LVFQLISHHRPILKRGYLYHLHFYPFLA